MRKLKIFSLYDVISMTFYFAISNFISGFLEKHGNDKNILSAWNSAENQYQLICIIKSFIIVKKTVLEKINTAYNFYKMYCKTGTSRPWNEWQCLQDEEKDKYMRMEQFDKRRYYRELRDCGGTSVIKKKYNGPKRPRNSYILFCTEKRPHIKKKYPELTGINISKKLGKMWHGKYSSIDKRKKWIDMAYQDKIRYEQELINYKQPSKPVKEPSKPVKEPSKPVKEPSKPVKEPSKPVKEPSKPVKEPSKPVVQIIHPSKVKKPSLITISGMVLFARRERDYYATHEPDLTNEEIATRIRRGWKELEDEEREEYEREASEL